MTNYTLELTDTFSTSEQTLNISSDFLEVEEIIGSMLSPYFVIYYIEDQKTIQVDLSRFTAVVYQEDEEIEWVGYGGLQNLRHSIIEADIRTMGGVINYNGQVYDSASIISLVVQLTQDLNLKNITVNGDHVIFVKVKSSKNLASEQRGEEWVEIVFQIDVLTNNF